MKTIAVTGGVGTGKSTLVSALQEKLRIGSEALFDCDGAVHKLLTTESILTKVAEAFGNEILNPDGGVNRSALRNIVFEDEARRSELEGILHPAVLTLAQTALENAANREDQPTSFFLIEVPLLYEVDFPVKRDLDLVVAASRETQINRLIEHRQLEPDTIERLLSSQLPISEKVERADLVIWNDGVLSEFKEQIDLLSQFLIQEQFHDN
ncbi:MAG: dephospho-CoA kinase [Verrucomicrobiales bacterium]|nr:dephospho-CoA kinase [Verrucomicrobiales bacterium]